MKSEFGLDKVLRPLIFATGSASWTNRYLSTQQLPAVHRNRLARDPARVR